MSYLEVRKRVGRDFESTDGSAWWEKTLRIVNDLIRHCADLDQHDRFEDPYSEVYATTIRKLLICSLFELRSQFEQIMRHLERHRLLTERLEEKHKIFLDLWNEAVRLHDDQPVVWSRELADLNRLLEEVDDFQCLEPSKLMAVADAAEELAHRVRAQMTDSHRNQDLY